MSNLPPLPPGFVIDTPGNAAPAPPPGFVLIDEPPEQGAAPTAPKPAADAPPVGAQPGSAEYAQWAVEQARAGKALPQVSSTEDKFMLPYEQHKFRRGTFAPTLKDETTGQIDWAWPQIAVDAYDAFMLPHDVMTGEVDPLSDEGIRRALGFSTTFAGGGIVAPGGKVTTAAGKAIPRAVVKALERDGLAMDEIRQAVMGIDPNAAVVADLGPNVQHMAAALATKPGEAQSTIVNTLGPRKAAAPERLTGALDDLLGPAPIPSQLQADIKVGKKALGPEYEAALGGASPVDTSSVAASLDAVIPTLRGEAQTQAISIRNMLNDTGADQLSTDPRVLFNVRGAIGDIIDAAGPNAGNLLGATRAQVDDLLAQSVPGVKAVDAKYAELSRQGEAVDKGQTVLGNGRTDLRPKELQDIADAGVLPQGEMVGPSGVTFRLSQGARAEIDRLVGTNLNDRAALNSMLKGQSDWNYQRLSTLFGKERVDKLYGLLENERKMADTENLSLSGSKTAAVTSAQKSVSPAERPAGFLQSLADLKPGTALFQTADRAVGKGAAWRREIANATIADIIMGNGDWRLHNNIDPVPVGLLIDAIMRGDEPRGGQ